jgi:hypothetical protein
MAMRGSKLAIRINIADYTNYTASIIARDLRINANRIFLA